MVRTGILFLVLQSVLLCATVQAEPGFAKSQQTDIVSALQSTGSGDQPGPDDNDGDGEFLRPTVFAAVVEAAPSAIFASPTCAPRAARQAANGIRAPPALA